MPTSLSLRHSRTLPALLLGCQALLRLALALRRSLRGCLSATSLQRHLQTMQCCLKCAACTRAACAGAHSAHIELHTSSGASSSSSSLSSSIPCVSVCMGGSACPTSSSRMELSTSCAAAPGAFTFPCLPACAGVLMAAALPAASGAILLERFSFFCPAGCCCCSAPPRACPSCSAATPEFFLFFDPSPLLALLLPARPRRVASDVLSALSSTEFWLLGFLFRSCRLPLHFGCTMATSAPSSSSAARLRVFICPSFFTQLVDSLDKDGPEE